MLINYISRHTGWNGYSYYCKDKQVTQTQHLHLEAVFSTSSAARGLRQTVKKVEGFNFCYPAQQPVVMCLLSTSNVASPK